MGNATRATGGFLAGASTNDIDDSAIIEGRSTEKGILVPRMTTTQRDAIATPATSLIIYNNTTAQFEYYNGSAWVAFGGGATPDLQAVFGEGFSAVSTSGLTSVSFDLEGNVIDAYVNDGTNNSSLILTETEASLRTASATKNGEIYSYLGEVVLKKTNIATSKSTLLAFIDPVSVSNVYVPKPITNGNYNLPLIINGQQADDNGVMTISVGSGTVTDVTATSPIVITGTSTVNPNVEMPLATNSVSGYLSSTDRASFDSRLLPTNNLADVNSVSTSRTNLGLGTLATQNGTFTDKADIASPTFTGTVTTPAIVVSSETASRVAIIDGSKNVKSADTATYPSLTELSYGKGVTSPIQTQLDNKASKIYTNIKDFGAIGDGTTDDTSSIQSAINSVVDGNIVLYFPKGQYKVSTQLSLWDTFNFIKIIGDNAVILPFMTDNLSTFKVGSNSSATLKIYPKSVEVVGLDFNYTNATPTSVSAGITFDTVLGVLSINNCNHYNFKNNNTVGFEFLNIEIDQR